MAKIREEIVGKRFLSVSSGDNFTLNTISRWDWRCGIIRACTHKDKKHADIQVLVEYDDVPWQRREWVHLYRDQGFKVFMIEHTLIWTPLKNTLKHRGAPASYAPALVFDLLLDGVNLKESNELPVENIVGRRLEFLDYLSLKKFQDSEWPWPCSSESEASVRSWMADQDGQHILCTTPSVLVGFRVQVYRSEGTTQWYTAVIVGYNEATRELTVTDDTVLEAHSEDPSLVHIRLLGEGVVQSILRGENIGITPRRSRSSVNNTQQTTVRLARTLQSSRSRKGSHSRSINYPSSPNQGFNPASPVSPLSSPNTGTKQAISPDSNVSNSAIIKIKTSKIVQSNSDDVEEGKDKSHDSGSKSDGELSSANGRESSVLNGKYTKQHNTDYQFTNPIKANDENSPNSPRHKDVSSRLIEDGSVFIAKQNCSKDQKFNSACKLIPSIEPVVQSNSAGNSDSAGGFYVESPELQEQPADCPRDQQSFPQTGFHVQLENEGRTSCNTDKIFRTSDKRNNSHPSVDPPDKQESKSDKEAQLNTYKFSESEQLVKILPDEVSHTEPDSKAGLSLKVELENKSDNLPDEVAHQRLNTNINGPLASPESAAKLSSEVKEEVKNNIIKNKPKSPEGSFIVAKVCKSSPTQFTSASSSCANEVTESQASRKPISRPNHKVSIVPVQTGPVNPVATDRQIEPRDGVLCSSSLTELSQSLAVAGAVTGRAVTITATNGPAPQGASRVASPPSVSITAVVRSPNSQPESAAHHQDGVSATQLQLLQHQLTTVSHPPSAGPIQSTRMDQCDGSSDSGVSVTERSVSRSSVLSDDRSSSAEVKPNTPTPNISQSKAANINITVDRKEPIKVWRNPAVVSQSDLAIRHIHSLQHNMSQHYPGVPSHVPSVNAPPGVASHPPSHVPPPQSSAALAHSIPPGLPYPPHHAPPLHLAHGLQNSLSAAAAIYPQLTPDLWKQLGHVANPLQNPYPRMMPRQEDFFLEFEKQNERMQRERREVEAREKEAKEKMDRERAEQRHREKREREERITRDWGDKDIQLVNQHFEESFRLASQKCNRDNLHLLDPSVPVFYGQQSTISHIQPHSMPQQSNKVYNAQKGHWNQNMAGLPHKVESRDLRQPPRSHSSQSNDLMRKVKEPQQLICDGICKAFKKDEHNLDLHMKSHPPPAHSKHPLDKNLTAGLSYPIPYGKKDAKQSQERGIYMAHHEKASVIVQPDMKYDKVPSHSVSPKQRHPGRSSPFSGSTVPVYKPYEAPSPHRPISSHISLSHSASPHGLEIIKSRQALSSPHSNPSISERYTSVAAKAPPMSHLSSLQSGSLASLQQSVMFPGKQKGNSPPHMYGKPGLISTPPISKVDTRATQQPISSLSAPPPAHTSNRHIDNRIPSMPSDQRNTLNCAPFDARAYSAIGSPHPRSNAASTYITSGPVSSPQLPAHHPTQVQPLDFTKEVICSIRKRATSPPLQEMKKARMELSSQPVLSRVSEPSPLYFPPATTITTIENVLAADIQRTVSPSSHSGVNINHQLNRCSPVTLNCNSNGSSSSASQDVSARNSPLCNSPNPTHRHENNNSPISTKKCDSDKAGSLGPAGYVHKLKKAWLQRHEDAAEQSFSNGSSTSRVASPQPNVSKLPRPEVKNVIRKMKVAISNGHVQKPKDADDSSTDSDESSSQKKQTKTKKSLKRSKKSSESDSDKESDGSEEENGKKSDRGKHDIEPRKKRGRKPKPKQKEEESKKSKDDPIPNDPLQKPPVSQLKKTGESFLQDRSCYEVAPKLPKCRECRWTPYQRNKKMPNIFCRFYAFRRLRYTKNGQLAVAGFSDPVKDAFGEDLRLWLPDAATTSPDLDSDKSKFLLMHVGDQFCDLFRQEKEAMKLHIGEETTTAWKRVVQGVREMCDVCETTLFNIHWACSKCGFVVCIDCYRARKEGTIKVWDVDDSGKERDKFSWLLCASRVPHEQDKLMLTQIIAGNALNELGHKIHETRHRFGIPMYCACSEAIKYKDMEQQENNSMNGMNKDLKKLKDVKTDLVNGKVKSEDSVNGKDDDMSNSPLSFFADVALSNDKRESESSMSYSDSDSDGKNSQPSTLRELLVRPNAKASTAAKEEQTSVKIREPSKKKARIDTLDDVLSCVIERESDKDSKKDIMKVELKHFIRKYNYSRKGREASPIRIMTKTESRQLYPTVPHSWLCDGKLLRLQDPMNDRNVAVFQDQWKRGQPVIVSGVGQKLNRDLWTPQSFSRDFGEQKNNLVNCLTDCVVPNQPIKKFWDGFENFSKRLKDDKGQPMLLKLKDWPPVEDFADVLPKRFEDLLKTLPMGQYTKRNGCYNLASRLPDCFVRPDLGPKMYVAYGSANYPGRASTNLHLDISDAANVMCYVGLPEDIDREECIKESLKAIDDAGCDILTRQRVRDKEELPGALWHIYHSRDSDKIRDLLNKVAIERGKKLEPYHDPIHDQSWYLDSHLRERLYKEYGVEGYAIVQCMGDAVFIPAGAPHQVRNILDCIKVAEDFVSPENISHCFHLTQEFRHLSDTHSNHEDKLQIKNIIYHAMKESVAVLMNLGQLAEPKVEKDS